MTEGGAVYRTLAEGELEAILRAHAEWVRSEGRAGERASLQLRDLEGADLEGADLRGANLQAADLTAANLEGADLRDANLQGVFLRGVNLQRVDLGGANLRGAFLSRATFQASYLVGANLGRADLVGAQLEEANLSGANLQRANLQRANLKEAGLERADLEGANLQRADLAGANLRRAKFEGANLRRAKLTGATLGGARFADTDLSAVLGLEECLHLGPSTLGTDTLAIARGTLPEAFLRGCGLQDWEIETAKLYRRDISAAEICDVHQRVFDLRNGKPLQFFSVFISHNHQDKPFARKLFDALQDKGIRCWLDERQLKPGDDIYEQIDRGIRHWDKLLLCASKNSLTSWWVDQEVNKAFEKERKLFKERGKKVLALIPLDLDGHLFNAYDGAKGDEIRSRIAADFTDESRFDAEVERVIAALRADDAAREPLPPKLL